MHPIERLRWIARAEDEPAASLAEEAAWTLGELGEQEPIALITACRRLLQRHPGCGPLWWASARLVVANDPLEAGRRAALELCSDATSERIGEALRGYTTASDTIVLTAPLELVATALESSKPYLLRVVGSSGSLNRSMHALSAATSCDVTVWSSGEEHEALDGACVLVVEVLAAGDGGVLVGRGSASVVRLAGRLGVPAWAAIGVGRALPAQLFEAAAERVKGGADRVALDEFSLAIGQDLTGDPAAVAAQVTCPPGSELLAGSC